MKLNNASKSWNTAAICAIDVFLTDNDYTNLENSLKNLNPYSLNFFEYEAYLNWITENMNALRNGDLTRISKFSSNSILNSSYDGDDDLQDKPKVFSNNRTLNQPGRMQRIQPEVDQLLIKCQDWIDTLVLRWSEFHEMDEDTSILIPEELRTSFRAVGLQTKEYLLPSSGYMHVAAAVDSNGIITADGKHIAWEDLEGELALVEVAYHLDEILKHLFTKTPEGIIQKILNETYGDMTAENGDSNQDVAYKICQALQSKSFLN